jgi:hypothetical protein
MPRARGRQDREAVTEAAAALRALLEAVDRGEIEAETPQARRLVRRLEGALAALEADGDVRGGT